MPVSFNLFHKFINPFRILTHLSVLVALVFYQFFYSLFTGFHLYVFVYSLCSLIFLTDILYLFFFFESRRKAFFLVLFFLDSLFLFGLTFVLGFSAVYPVLFLAVLQMLYMSLLLDWLFVVIYGLWLSCLMALAFLFRGELTVGAAAFINLSLCFSVFLSVLVSKSFHFFMLKFQILEERYSELEQSKALEAGHRPEPHFEWALHFTRQLRPALKTTIHNTTQANMKKLTGFHHFINRFIEFAEPSWPEDRVFNEIENFNECIKGFVEKMKDHPDRPEDLKERLNLKSKGLIKGSVKDLEKVFDSILQNAFQALKTKEGRKQIVINTYDFNRWLVSEVIDNGHGMEEEELKQVFDPLFSKRFHSGGVGGLGLSLSEKIIKAHGGSIELQSVLRKSTLVRIKLPLVPLEKGKAKKRSA